MRREGMTTLLLGLAGFGLYLIYDINSITIDCRPLRLGFLLGSLFIGGATLWQLAAAFRSGYISGLGDLVFLALGLASFGALIYCLFFALPFQETYTAPENGRPVYTCGAYALCRHPGVLCFFAMYLFWGLAALPSDVLWIGMLFSILNGMYAWFQDRVTFPKTFRNYEDYRAKAPFLIPNLASIRRARETWGDSYKKEEEL